ncbi:hypothetical protein EBN03_29980 [Nocardia stercoris]|uniref:Uncharacterized protein n=1 Tax=Nocardia stercoris TaxID=2483361 RepID=A0A3M2KY43_9NOCA|nr:hypothetical protein EBN03_29980 [Nocardia stercoris]
MASTFGSQGFSAGLRCDVPAQIESFEAAQTLLRMHHQCCSARCMARQSARQFVDYVAGVQDRRP